MKQLFISIFLILVAVPCLAQWHYEGTNGQVLAFGVHDTSLFFSFEGHLYGPNGEADANLDFTQGNFTTFASAGPNFFTGSYNSDDIGIGGMTTNDGTSWSVVIGGPVGSNGTYVFARHSKYIARSTDNGNSWQYLPYPNGSGYAGTGSVVYSVAANYWAGTSSGGLWRSLDSGYTWSKLPKQPPFVGTLVNMGSLLFLYQNYRYWVSGSNNGMLIMSRDSGMTWDTAHIDSAGMPEYITTLATDGKNLFAGGVSTVLDQGTHFGNGLYVSTDTGQHWRAVNDGLTSNMNIEAIGLYPYDSTIYISTNNNNFGATSGISYATYYRPINEIVDTSKSVVQEVPVLPSDSIEIYPNPASGLVSIRSGGTGILGIRVLNVLGSETGSGFRGPGSGNVSIDLSWLPAGTYFLEIQTSSGLQLRNITLER